MFDELTHQAAFSWTRCIFVSSNCSSFIHSLNCRFLALSLPHQDICEVSKRRRGKYTHRTVYYSPSLSSFCCSLICRDTRQPKHRDTHISLGRSSSCCKAKIQSLPRNLPINPKSSSNFRTFQQTPDLFSFWQFRVDAQLTSAILVLLLAGSLLLLLESLD